MKRLVFDLDNTLTLSSDSGPVNYAEVLPRLDVVEKLRAYKESGFAIIICTARNMRSHQNSVGLINAKTLPIILTWLERHQIPYDEIHVGKPWCGDDGFYIDDKAIRPSEFVRLSYAEITQLLNRETS